MDSVTDRIKVSFPKEQTKGSYYLSKMRCLEHSSFKLISNMDMYILYIYIYYIYKKGLFLSFTTSSFPSDPTKYILTLSARMRTNMEWPNATHFFIQTQQSQDAQQCKFAPPTCRFQVRTSDKNVSPTWRIRSFWGRILVLNFPDNLVERGFC